MVKVRSLRRAKRILVMAGVLLFTVSAAEARLFGSKKAQKPADAAPMPSTLSLNSVEVDGSRVVLRTSGAPAYTSYSPSPGVFVVDLTGTSKGTAVLVPSTLPPAVASLAADDVVEMGSHLTRITMRFTESVHPETAAVDNAVIITIPASAIAIESAPAPADPLPAVVATPEPAPATVAETPEPRAETIEPVAAPSGTATAEGSGRHNQTGALPRARLVQQIAANASDGSVDVRISADGSLKYKAFRLEQPSRLVIDLDGVKNAAKKGAVMVDDEVVKRVRIAQYQPTVARVVIDLAHKAEYTINNDGDELRVSFGATPIAKFEPAPTPAATTIAVVEKPEPVAPQPQAQPAATPRQAAVTRHDDIPASIPVIAEKAEWKVPPPASKGARKVISAPVDQAPPATTPTQTTTTTSEDIFNEPAVQRAAVTLSGTRTLSGGPHVFTGEPISLNLKDADLKDVLRTFAELTGLNMAIDPGVGGSVTVDFQDVPWDQALDIILRQNGLTFILEGNVLRIGTIDRIAAETAAQRRLADEERLNVPLTTLSFKLSYARATEVQALLRDLASPRARIIVDGRTNQLIISEIPAYLQTMQNLLTTIDIPTRQVMIEARIVESTRTFVQQWGFNWGFNGDLDPALGSGTGLVFPNRVGFTGGPFDFSAGKNVLSFHFFDVLGAFSLDFALSAAEAQGYVKVVSAPRVTTQDNTAAQITSGVQIPIQTRVNFTTTVQYIDATLQLQVTPQITEAGTVIMDIQVQKNEPATGLSIAGAAGTPLTTRTAKTRLMVRDGGTAVIAGIFQTKDNKSESRMPFVHNIPILGALFRTHDINTSHDELLIFITPRIVRG
ncbi:MAG: hypothetical protein DMF56_27370 [Acidobacteria bacterium]|nr:MAG: hypothetical protein DMF56_27370 [Acidobacteriota bacterium]